MQWYYSKNATQMGPVSDAELRAKIAAGEITGADLVWREGMVDWRPVSAVAELGAGTLAPGQNGVSPYAPPVAQGAYVAAAPVSGLAVASLVCGILGLVTCSFFPGIPAVICGHMALSRMANPAVPLGGRGMAVAGLVTGYLSVAAIVGTILVFVFAFLGAFL